MKKTLIVVDMQNDFIDMALGTKEAVAIVPKVKTKIQEYVKNGENPELVIYKKEIKISAEESKLLSGVSSIPLPLQNGTSYRVLHWDRVPHHRTFRVRAESIRTKTHQS